MSTQVQFRRGSTSDISTFVGASGEIIVDTTKHTCVVNDGVQIAGYPLLREDGSNSSLIPGSTSNCSLKFANDSNTGIISPGPDQIALVTGGATRLAIDSAGSISIPGNLLLSGSLIGSFQFSDGSAASPSIGFVNDPDTGIFRGAANQIGISTGGAERFRVDSTGAVTIFNSLATTNSNTAASFIPTGATVPANGIYLAATNTIGIATNSTARFTVSTTAASSTLPIDVPLGSVSSPSITFTGDTNTGIYSPGADQVAISTNGTGRLFVDSSGRLGVGTSSPSELLHVSGTSNPSIQLTATNDTTPAISVATNGTDRLQITSSSVVGGNINVRSNQNLRFGTNNTERMRLDSSGRLGLGTSSPSNTAGFSQQLEVAGSLPCISINQNNGSFSTRKYSLGVDSVAGFGIWDNTASAYRMYINSSGQVGIGSTLAGNANNRLLVRSDSASAISNVLLLNNGPADNNAGQGVRINLSGVSEANSNIRYAYIESATSTAGNDHYIAFGTNAAAATPLEAVRIDSSRRLLVGTSSARSAWNNSTIAANLIQVERSGDGLDTAISICANSGTSSPADTASIIYLGKTRGTTVGATTAVASGDCLGRVSFQGSDGTEQVEAAKIEAYVDATPGSNDMPGRLVFSTTADGASSPTERLAINSVGRALFSNSTAVAPGTDDATALGLGSFRWSAVYAANGTIQTSDERAKTSVNNATLGANFIKSLRPVSYKWIEGGKRDTGERDEKGNYIYESVPGERRHWGFIAQEVKEAVDAAGVDFGGWVLTDKDDPDSQQALRYDQFIAPLTKALQEALAKIEVLEAKVAALEAS